MQLHVVPLETSPCCLRRERVLAVCDVLNTSFSGVEDDEWDDDWDDVKSSGGYAESESGDSGAIQRGGAHASTMKISLNK